MEKPGIKEEILKAIKASPGTNPSKKIQITFGLTRQAVLFHIDALLKSEKITAKS